MAAKHTWQSTETTVRRLRKLWSNSLLPLWDQRLLNISYTASQGAQSGKDIHIIIAKEQVCGWMVTEAVAVGMYLLAKTLLDRHCNRRWSICPSIYPAKYARKLLLSPPRTLIPVDPRRSPLVPPIQQHQPVQHKSAFNTSPQLLLNRFKRHHAISCSTAIPPTSRSYLLNPSDILTAPNQSPHTSSFRPCHHTYHRYRRVCRVVHILETGWRGRWWKVEEGRCRG
jgi:hypothetical protein